MSALPNPYRWQHHEPAVAVPRALVEPVAGEQGMPGCFRSRRRTGPAAGVRGARQIPLQFGHPGRAEGRDRALSSASAAWCLSGDCAVRLAGVGHQPSLPSRAGLKGARCLLGAARSSFGASASTGGVVGSSLALAISAVRFASSRNPVAISCRRPVYRSLNRALSPAQTTRLILK